MRKHIFSLFRHKWWTVICVSLVSIIAFMGNGTAFARSANPKQQPGSSYRLIRMMTGPNVPVAAPFWAFDIGWVDAEHHLYYLADGSNRRVDIFDTRSMTFLSSIGGFTGFDGSFGDFTSMGPSGLVGDGHGHLFVSDGNSTLKIISLDRTGTLAERVTTINTGGSARADEMAYAPLAGGLVWVGNSGDTPPFLSLVSVPLRRVIARHVFPEATAGLEQPVFDRQLGLLFVSVPSTTTHPGGEVDVLSPTLSILHRFVLPACQPNGLALDPRTQTLAVGCAVGHPLLLHVLDSSITTIPQLTDAGVDVVAYNPGDRCFYFAAAFASSGPVVGVVEANGTWLTAIATSPFAHSVAVDRQTGQVFVPEGGPQGGVGVFHKENES